MYEEHLQNSWLLCVWQKNGNFDSALPKLKMTTVSQTAASSHTKTLDLAVVAEKEFQVVLKDVCITEQVALQHSFTCSQLQVKYMFDIVTIFIALGSNIPLLMRNDVRPACPGEATCSYLNPKLLR